jgi:hypothetical protein
MQQALDLVGSTRSELETPTKEEDDVGGELEELRRRYERLKGELAETKRLLREENRMRVSRVVMSSRENSSLS